MIQINCGLTHPTSDPVLQPLDSIGYSPEMETPTRAIFRLPDSEAGKAATFYFGGSELEYTIPPPGAHEGPHLKYVSVGVVQLRIEGNKFLRPDGSEWVWAGHIDFMLRKRSLDGMTIEPHLRERKKSGSYVVVTLEMAHYIERYYPDDYGVRYWDHIRPFAKACAAEGFWWCPILLADAQEIKKNVSDQQRYVQRWAEHMAGEPNLLPSLGNEWPQNGWHPGNFAFPGGDGLLWSRGSTTSDAPPFPQGWGWKEWHGRRDMPKVFWSHDDMLLLREGNTDDGPGVPTIGSEPIGFWHTDVRDRRSSNAHLAKVLGGCSVYFGNGSNGHSQEGLRSESWHPHTAMCIAAQLGEIQKVSA